MEIRALGAADAEAYWALRMRALREEPRAFGAAYEEQRDRPLAVTATMLGETSEAAGKFILGAVDDSGRLVGMVRVTREQGAKVRHRAALTGMYAIPEVRGQGVGRALMQAAIARARAVGGLEQLMLGVAVGNAPARSLYLACGFVVFGMQPRTLKLSEGRYVDEELMLLELG